AATVSRASGVRPTAATRSFARVQRAMTSVSPSRRDRKRRESTAVTSEAAPPGVATRRYLPKFHYELIVCGVRGHELVGMDAAEIGPDDGEFVRESGGLRWYRCLRCDSWLPLEPPTRPLRDSLPPEDEIELPLRGKALRDKIVLRVIAVDRALHFVVLGALAVLIFVFAAHRSGLQRLVGRIDEAFYGAPTSSKHHAHGLLHDLE